LGVNFVAKIDSFIAFAPIIFLEHLHSTLTVLADCFDFVKQYYLYSNSLFFTSKSFAESIFSKVVFYFPRTTIASIKAIVGYNNVENLFPYNRIGMVARFDTGGCSSKNFLHYS
jgi:hypothetical protein